MRLFGVRFSFLALLIGAIFVVSASAAQAFGIKEFFAANCNEASPNCKKPAKPEEEKTKAEAEGFTKAGGHPPFGVTDFTVNTHVIQTVPFEAVAPEGVVDHVRTDVAPGLSTNPQAVAKCSAEEFGDKKLGARNRGLPGTEMPPWLGHRRKQSSRRSRSRERRVRGRAAVRHGLQP